MWHSGGHRKEWRQPRVRARLLPNSHSAGIYVPELRSTFFILLPCLFKMALRIYSDVHRNLKDLLLLGTSGFHIPQKAIGQKDNWGREMMFSVRKEGLKGLQVALWSFFHETGCYPLWERAQKPGFRTQSCFNLHM